MPDLSESLQGRDLGHLRIIAGLWGIQLDEQDPSLAIIHLRSALLASPAVEATLSRLNTEARQALDDLAHRTGRLPWAQFTRAYGEVREMGAAKRDREKPYEHPISAAEVLWYRALVARAFFDSPSGPEEFAYIPDDLLELIPQAGGTGASAPGRRAAAIDYASIMPANDRIVDHTCTALAALRLGITPPDTYSSSGGEELSSLYIKSLLASAGLLDQDGIPMPEPVRKFLEARRGEALGFLFQAWKTSPLVNELRLLPELIMEGNWDSDARQTRLTLLDFITLVPGGLWWSLDSFISAIKQRSPDFQRPAGDYDSWFIRQKTGGEYLRGFEHWDEVDGRLIRYILLGPLHWLGVLDLACQDEGQPVTAFRLSGWSRDLLKGKTPKGLPEEDEPLIVRSDARISSRRLVRRDARYQVSRFCDWVKETLDDYQYRITPASLARARQQGLTVAQLLTLLNHHAKAVSPSLVKALERWDKQGSEARLEKMVVLRVVSEDILQALRKSRASRFLGETLGPTSVAVNPGAVEKVLGALAELGYLGEIRGEMD